LTNQLKFDGPRLEDVLLRVRDEIGENAVIVEANRTLRGGVAGFFAKEWFEVVVEANPEADLLAWADRVEDSSVAQAEPTLEFEQVLATATRPALATIELPSPKVELPSPEKALSQLPLAEMLEALDAIVPSPFHPAPGPSVIVFAGEMNAAMLAAGAFAKRLGQNSGDIVAVSKAPVSTLPAWMQINSKAAARQRGARWRMGDTPVVVAIDLVPGLDGHNWASEMIGALGADHVRLVANAWQVITDIAPKAAMLGGVDGLELVGLADSATPEIFLDLGFPVLGLDGRVATSELWAALLMERRNDEKR